MRAERVKLDTVRFAASLIGHQSLVLFCLRNCNLQVMEPIVCFVFVAGLQVRIAFSVQSNDLCSLPLRHICLGRFQFQM